MQNSKRRERCLKRGCLTVLGYTTNGERIPPGKPGTVTEIPANRAGNSVAVPVCDVYPLKDRPRRGYAERSARLIRRFAPARPVVTSSAPRRRHPPAGLPSDLAGAGRTGAAHRGECCRPWSLIRDWRAPPACSRKAFVEAAAISENRVETSSHTSWVSWARARVERDYSWDSIARAQSALYRELLAGL